MERKKKIRFLPLCRRPSRRSPRRPQRTAPKTPLPCKPNPTLPPQLPLPFKKTNQISSALPKAFAQAVGRSETRQNPAPLKTKSESDSFAAVAFAFQKRKQISSALPKAFAQAVGRSEPPQKTRFRPHSENPGISDFPTACFQQVTDAKIIITDVITWPRSARLTPSPCHPDRLRLPLLALPQSLPVWCTEPLLFLI